MTNNLERRVAEHKQQKVDGFSKKYNTSKLIYFECYSNATEAITREKQLKNWNRNKKNNLVNALNIEWLDLSEGWYQDPSTSSYAKASEDKTLGMTGEEV